MLIKDDFLLLKKGCARVLAGRRVIEPAREDAGAPL